MTEEMTKEQVEFSVGDPIVDLITNEKGKVSRFCSDKGVIYIRWDKDGSQEMVETKSLRKE